MSLSCLTDSDDFQEQADALTDVYQVGLIGKMGKESGSDGNGRDEDRDERERKMGPTTKPRR